MTAISSWLINSMQHCQVMNLILHTKKQRLSRISALLVIALGYIVQYSSFYL